MVRPSRIRALRDAVASAASSNTSGISDDSTQRRCPYCGDTIDLRRCDVVSTAPGTWAQEHQNQFDNLDEPDTGRKVSSSHEVLFSGQRDAALRGRPSFQEGFRSQLEPTVAMDSDLIPVTELAPAHLMPRRICESCRHILPLQLDTRDSRVLAIAGVNLAGKTHFLIQSLYEGMTSTTLVVSCTNILPPSKMRAKCSRGISLMLRPTSSALLRR
jgi:hypothetical protein